MFLPWLRNLSTGEDYCVEVNEELEEDHRVHEDIHVFLPRYLLILISNKMNCLNPYVANGLECDKLLSHRMYKTMLLIQ
jgi:hypothetical protein